MGNKIFKKIKIVGVNYDNYNNYNNNKKIYLSIIIIIIIIIIKSNFLIYYLET